MAASGGIIFATIVSAAAAAAKAAAAVGLQAMGRSQGKGGGSGEVGALRLPLDASYASEAHLLSFTRDEEKQEKQDW